ncbi:MAG: TIGR03790 family protein [Burkholderiales bacterium]|nr:TIGR03790 family protein [Burkholderiales bacterium]
MSRALAVAAVGFGYSCCVVPGLALADVASPPGGPAAFAYRTFDFSAPSAPAVLHSAQWLRIPRTDGRLTSADIGLVINDADPYSVAVGEFYIKARRLAPDQVLHVTLPARATLTPEEFKALAATVDSAFGGAVQALALAWTVPYAVNCNSITGALTLGYDPAVCENTCAPSKRSPYFDAATSRPYRDLKLRPSMLLAADDVATAKAMIRRGVQADASLGLVGGPPVNAYFVTTDDRARSARTPFFPPPGLLRRWNVDVHVDTTQAVHDARRVLLYETGLAQVGQLDTLSWVPGALADHLTSFGGQLDGGSGQMSILAWITSGATASYGTVSEPCSHPQKFPHPQVLLLNYLQGASAIEAYWKSVAWPQQGVFVGEPLAAPFAHR